MYLLIFDPAALLMLLLSNNKKNNPHKVSNSKYLYHPKTKAIVRKNDSRARFGDNYLSS
jgi:hypothetical protein